jgi:hypothetical protein
METASMNVDVSKQQAMPTGVSPEREMIDDLYRGLVRIHSAIAVRTNDDTVVIPWTERELMTLIERLGAFRRARDGSQDAARRDDDK